MRLLSAMPFRIRPRLVTTTGEFHTIRRQLDRLAEEGMEVVRVPEAPLESLSIPTRSRHRRPHRAGSGLGGFLRHGPHRAWPGRRRRDCRTVGAWLLVDAYHALNVVPFSLAEQGLGDAFVVGGGYKYCQLGEGNCFLRIPAGTDLRPVITGWYSEFTALADRQRPDRVAYGEGGDRFAGATYDPTSHYRAAAVFRFFQDQGLTPPLLREVSQHQIGLLASRFDALDLDPNVLSRDRDAPVGEIGGFLALKSPVATALTARLRKRGVWTDARGDVLRMGPAPYLSDRQLEDAVAILGEVVREGRS